MPGWLLINAIGKNHPNATINLRGMYKRGDVIDVHPPAWQHGAKEILPKFYRLLVNDKPVAFLEKYLLAEDDGVIDAIEDPTPRRIRRRAYRIVIEDLPPPVRNALNNIGEADINWRQLRSSIREKKTNMTEENRD